MQQTVTAFSYDAARGALKDIHAASTLAEPKQGNSTAEVQVHPSGKFLYGSNRGHDSLAVSIDQESGELTAVGHQLTGGKVGAQLRHLAVAPPRRGGSATPELHASFTDWLKAHEDKALAVLTQGEKDAAGLASTLQVGEESARYILCHLAASGKISLAGKVKT